MTRRTTRRRGATITAVMAALTLALSGCGVSLAADETAAQFGGGMAEDRDFKGCKAPGSNEVFGAWGDDYLPIPAGQRTYKAADESDVPEAQRNAEQGAMTFTVRGVEMQTDVQIELVANTDCTAPEGEVSPMEDLATRFGLKYRELHDDAWWTHLLRDYVGRQADQALDDAAAVIVADLTAPGGEGQASQAWRLVYENADTKERLETLAGERAVTLIEDAMGARLFCGPGYRPGDEECPPLEFTITPPRPTDPALIDGIIEEQAAAQDVKTAEQERLANEARVAAEAELLEAYGPQGVLERQRNDLLRQAIEGGQITVWPVPTGAGVTLPQPPQPAAE